MKMVGLRAAAIALVITWGATLLACGAKATPSRRLVFDFESDETPWTVIKGDVSVEPARRGAAVHRHGRGFLDTGKGTLGAFDVDLRGKLRSPPFTIDHAYLVFRAGGRGPASKCSLSLRSARTDTKLRSLSTAGDHVVRMQTQIWDVADLQGESVVLQLLDRGKLDRCSIHLDYVRLVDG